MTLKSVTLENGETITYRERDGGHHPVVLVHGNMTSSKHWDLLMDELDPSLKLFALDMRGFGGSSYREPVTGISDFAEDLADFIDRLGLENFDLIGWSTGGAVCMQYTAEHPGRVRRLVLLASASTRGYPFFGTKDDGTPDSGRRLQSLEEVRADAGKTRAIQGLYDTKNREGLKAVWNALIYSHRQPDSRKYEEYVDDMLTQRNLAEVYHALNTFNISSRHNGLTEGTDQAKDITVPVLVLRGDRDYVVTEEMTQEIMADLGGNAEYRPLTDSGHSPLVDDLDQLVQKIHGFLLQEETE
ncbi:alpha/beta fold hydrolase [Indiicoccus explosivorum]|uniref:intracellular short-chain-length polyhydroxyalkanoate depolymerase n=1 Tax=Indiicoccus explosivorum TaxID=1917864 RepID=UPI000B438E2E|nr:alpha/beta hydrolase [Indiicoccus explosivorum]